MRQAHEAAKRGLLAEVTQPGPPPSLDLAATMPGTDQESGRGLALTRLLVELTCAERDGATVWTLARTRS